MAPQNLALCWFSPPSNEPGPAAELTRMVLQEFGAQQVGSRAGDEAAQTCGELPIYQLEDRPADLAATATVLVNNPGIVVLHGSAWPQLCLEAARQDGASRDRYLAAVEDGWGADGRAMALEAVVCGYRPGVHDPVVLTSFELLLGDSLGVVVSSDELFERLAAFERWPLLRLSPPVPPGLPRRERVARSAGCSAGRPLRVLVVEGDSGGHGVGAVVAALAEWGARARAGVALCVVAPGHRQQFWRLETARCGLDGLVEVRSSEDLAVVLENSDVAIDLTAQGSQGCSAMARLFRAYGLPVLVSHSGWYGPSGDAESWCARLDDRGEREDIQRFLAAALAEPEAFERRARRVLERLQHEATAAAWVASVRDFAAKIEQHPETWRARFLLGRFARAMPRCRAAVLPSYRRAAVRVIEPLLASQELANTRLLGGQS